MGLDKSNNTVRQAADGSWAIPIGLLVIGLVILLGNEAARVGLRYDRVAIADGQLWRLISGHLCHLGWTHFVLNGAGLLVIWSLVGTRFTLRAWLTILVVVLLVIDVGFWVLNPELSWYVGLSGLLHGILAAGLVARIGWRDTETRVLAVLLLVKLLWEQIGGAMPGSAAISGGPVIVAAHLYGTMGGILGAAWLRMKIRSKASH